MGQNNYIISEVLLAEVPFNDTYENVWDIKSTRDVYSVLRSELIPHTRAFDYFRTAYERGFNANKQTELILTSRDVDGIPMDVFKHYNYCAIELQEYKKSSSDVAPNPIVLYFIEDVIYDYSSGICKLQLKYDEWLNNAGQFFDLNGNVSQTVTKCTKNMWTFTTDGESGMWRFDLDFFNDKVKMPQSTYEKCKPTKTSFLLWCCYCCTNDQNTYLNSKYNSSPFYTGMLEVYIPLCSVENSFVSGANVTDNRMTNKLTLINNTNLSNQAIATLESITSNKFITTSPPFTCEYNISEKKYVCDAEFTNTIFINGSQVSFPSNVAVIVNKKTNEPFSRSSSIARSDFSVNKRSMGGRCLTQPNTVYQHLSNIYPYYYKSVVIAGKKIDFIPQTNANFFKCSTYQISSFKYLQYGNDNSDWEYVCIPIEITSSFPLFKDPSVWNVLYKTSEDNLTSFNFLSSIINSAAKGGLGVSSLIGAGSSLVSLENKRARRDEELSTISSGINSLNLYYEIPIVVEHSVSEEEHNQIATEFERYGNEREINITPSSVYNHKFDYFLVPSPVFRNLDNYCKKTIENMFKKGVRIWHVQNLIDIGLFDYQYTHPAIPAKNQSKAVIETITMSYDRANVPMTIINGEGVNLLSKDND